MEGTMSLVKSVVCGWVVCEDGFKSDHERSPRRNRRNSKIKIQKIKPRMEHGEGRREGEKRQEGGKGSEGRRKKGTEITREGDVKVEGAFCERSSAHLRRMWPNKSEHQCEM